MIAVFDLDHTLISANSSYCFGAFLFRRGQISYFKTITLIAAYAIHKMGILSLHGLHNYCFRALFKNRSAQQIHFLAEFFLDEKLADLLNSVVVERLKKHQAQGDETHLFSSSPSFIVESIAHRLNIKHVYCTRYGIDSEGMFNKIELLVTGSEKESQLESIRSNRSTIAYSDSILDAPLLLKVDQAVCVNPDWKLRRLAQQHQWEVL